MTYRRATENSTDDKDATTTLGTRSLRLRITRGYTSTTSSSVAETLSPDGFALLADIRRWGLRIKIFLLVVSLSIREF